MTSPRTTRRHAMIAIAAVWVLVLGGLGWATRSAIQLEQFEAREERKWSLDGARAAALSKIDARVATVLQREQGRPYEHFRSHYKPAHAYDERDGAEVSETILLESPLVVLPGPAWLLLHFQTTEGSESERWTSPQIPDDRILPFTRPAWAMPAEQRRTAAKPENWLLAMKDRYTPLALLEELEHVVAAEGRVEALDGADERTPELRGIRHRTAEFLRRGARLALLQSEDSPDACVPQTVAYENLEIYTALSAEERPSPDCVEVLPTPMEPVWLDVTEDGHKQLAFIRTVTAETGDFCTLQGVLIDWPMLQEELEVEVRKLFPNARIVPVDEAAGGRHDVTHTMMQTIPARLETGEPVSAALPGISTSSKVGLSVAWGSTILALAAIAYGTMKYVTLAERRMRFVSAVTHELRTPLTSFQLHSDLLADMPEEDAVQRRRHAETLRSESRRLARLVENVLAYARVGVTEPALRWKHVLPRELLAAVRSATTQRCATSNKELVVENRCKDGLAIETDSEFAVQILANLVENACKYSADADDCRIWLTASQVSDGSVDIEVDDAGPGVPPHDRREVFQPFHRAGSAGGGRGGGLGLGLALSRYWASCLGGRLTLRRSPRDGAKYTSFVLSLPIIRTG